MIQLNQEEYKKVQIFKDVIIPIVEAIRVEQSDSLEQLRHLQGLWELETAKVVQSSVKMNKFQEKLSMRLVELEEIFENQPGLVDNYENKFEIQDLREFWKQFVEDVIVERVKDDDRELLAIQQIWLQYAGVQKKQEKLK